MTIDPSEITRAAMLDFGRPADIDGEPIEVLFNHAPYAADPYISDTAHDGPSAIALRDDLAAIDQWPLDADEITIDNTDYRIVSTDHVDGDVTLYLREM